MMKRIVYSIITGMMALATVSCADDTAFNVNPPVQGEGKVTLAFTSGITSRAADVNKEFAVSHLDVFFFSEDENMAHYERVEVNNTATDNGSVELTAERSDFTKDGEYMVYVLANSTAGAAELGAMDNLNELKSLLQTDDNLHLTGSEYAKQNSAEYGVIPDCFLMDGIAGTGATTSTQPVTVNDGGNNDLALNVYLRRAASKVMVTMRPYKADDGSQTVRFYTESDMPEEAAPGYYLRNMPVSTSVLAEVDANATLRTPKEIKGDCYTYNADGSVTVTGYVYSHSWEEERYFEKGTSLIVDVPMWEDTDGDGVLDEGETAYPSNYYQVFLRPSGETSFGRNMLYEVEVSVSAPGAVGADNAVTVESNYEAHEWTIKTVDVNGTNAPKYLEVNKTELKIYNTDQDLTSLYFTSSSEIESVVISDVYYWNKFGLKISVFDETLEEGETYPNMKGEVDAGATSGNIKIYSDNPTNNAIRYYTLTITNKEGISRTIKVEQYPLIWITNSRGFYSYRQDDNDGKAAYTSYEKYDTAPYKTNCLWNFNANKWKYANSMWTVAYTTQNGENQVSNTATYRIQTMFRPQVRVNSSGVKDDNETTGYSAISYYYYYSANSNQGKKGEAEGNNRYYYQYRYPYTNSNGGGYGNARRYYIHVSATSDKYKVGRPKMTGTDEFTGVVNAYTDPGEDNAELVSPSFMIASQLGITSSFNAVTITTNMKNLGLDFTLERTLESISKMAEQHCARYVEVDDDGTHIKNWRLPTRKELEFLVEAQTSSKAMDQLFTGTYYQCASGAVKKSDGSAYPTSGGSIYIRCVKDVYDE